MQHKKVKYARRKHQTDMTSLAVMAKLEPKKYQELARSMHWVTVKK